MSVPSPRLSAGSLLLVLAMVIVTLALLANAEPARTQIGPIPSPCDLPGPGYVCDAVGDLAGDVAGAAGDFIMRGVTVWVTNAAVWVTGKVGELIEATASPDVQARWFVNQYASMLAVAAVLALPLLLLAVIQALLRQDVWILLRSAFGYLPMAFILAGAAIVGTDLLISITDDLSAMVTRGLGERSDNLLQSVGDAYSTAIEDDSDGAVPLFGVFLGAIILAIGAFVLWLEMIIRDAAIYIGLFFVPLTFIAMIWPTTGRYARRLVEFLIAVILAKFVIVAIIGLASAAITNAGAGGGDGQVFERMIGGSALLVLAAWSPFALLRLIPLMEIAAAGVTSQRSSMSSATHSAGIQTPAAYMRQAMDRHSRASTAPAYPVEGGTTYGRVEQHPESASSKSRHEVGSERQTINERPRSAASRGPGGTTYSPSRPTGPEPVGTPPRDHPEPPSAESRRPTPPPEPPTDRRPPGDEE
ncbi:MAG: type IV secretion system protein [Gaiellaceae bacterium]